MNGQQPPTYLFVIGGRKVRSGRCCQTKKRVSHSFITPYRLTTDDEFIVGEAAGENKTFTFPSESKATL